MELKKISVIEKFPFLSDNGAPEFRNTSQKLFAIKNQENVFVINAMDPENKSVTYQIIGNPRQDLSLINNGTLTFKPTENGEVKFTIRATDICGAYTDQEIIISTLQCPCEGYCRRKDGNSTELECVCPKGCTGEQCNESLPGTTSCHHSSGVLDLLRLYLYPFAWNVKECCVSCVNLVQLHLHQLIWSPVEGEEAEEEIDVDNIIIFMACCVVGVFWGFLFLLGCCKRTKKETTKR